MEKTFLFYDLETSGLNPAFDQIIQFAAIRTDLQLNELERYEWIIRPNKDVVPHPAAMVIHRTPLTRWQQGEPELTVLQRIHALFNTPGTLNLGYNTLGFDDEFLRFSFYRNLLTPYTHQYANACQRMDLYPITALYYLFHPEILQWPIRKTKLSLKLDALTEENHLTQGAAHTAIVDVEASIALAKKFIQQAQTWSYVLGYFNKTSDIERAEKLPFASTQSNPLNSMKYGLLIEGIYGGDTNFCVPILKLGTHYHYKNQTCWLRLDGEKLMTATEENFLNSIWVINKKLGEPGFLLPPTEKYLQKLTLPARTLLQENLAWLGERPRLLKAIARHYLNFTYPTYPSIDPSATLYLNGFWNSEQQQQCQAFHREKISNKKTVIDFIRDPILKILAIRALARYDEKLLSEQQKTMFEEDAQHQRNHPSTILDYKGQQKLSQQQALEEIQHLESDPLLDEEQKRLLMEYKAYLWRKG